ncbi:MAG: glutamate synthase subunit beta [Magnetococcus sp. DMHC-6]
MGNPTAFMEIERQTPATRPVAERVLDWQELYQTFPLERLQEQASRCMDCGVPFCHNGCTLYNLAPVFNEWVYRGQWAEALRVIQRTNNFPEFTGRICPSLCEASCVSGIGGEAVSIRQIEKTIAEEGFKRGLVVPFKPFKKTGKRVAVVGSGPAGLAASQQLTRAGHEVTLFEKNARVGGLLRFGIPDFKLDKKIIDRRMEQLIAEGLTIRTGVHVGKDLSVAQLRADFDAILLTGGAEKPRDLSIPGRTLSGIHFAMEFLAQQNRRLAGDDLGGEPEITAKGKKVVVIGGGDTGSDCVGTSIRQGAISVTQIELLPKPPQNRSPATPWPEWPNMLRISTSHEEGCERMWSITTHQFIGEGDRLQRLQCARLRWEEPENGGRPTMTEIPDSTFTLEADLALLALGFLHPVHEGLLTDLGVERDPRGNVKTNTRAMTSIEGIFSAGDMATGQSLVVKSIASGRAAAREIDGWLRGGVSVLL